METRKEEIHLYTCGLGLFILLLKNIFKSHKKCVVQGLYSAEKKYKQFWQSAGSFFSLSSNMVVVAKSLAEDHIFFTRKSFF